MEKDKQKKSEKYKQGTLVKFFKKSSPKKVDKLKDTTNIPQENSHLSVNESSRNDVKAGQGAGVAHSDEPRAEDDSKNEYEGTNLKKRKREVGDCPSSSKTKSSASTNDPGGLRVSGNISFPNDDFSFFTDDWENEIFNKALNLCTLKRCEIVKLSNDGCFNLTLTLKCQKDLSVAECKVLPPWSTCTMKVGDILSVKARKENGSWVVDRSCILVLHSDDLISGTNVVGSLFCLRKAVLSNLIRDPGSDSNSAMFVGSLIHEFFQDALQSKVDTLKGVFELYERKVKTKEYLQQLLKGNLDYNEISDQLTTYLPRIYETISKYFQSNGTTGQRAIPNQSKWNGQITDVQDIEENIWSPELGIKGKIDVTVKVKIHNSPKIMPLELKTGKSSFSPEHRGQVILYCMILSQILGKEVDSGLLLYLRDCQMEQIKAGDAEKRDLIMCRNNLADWLIRSKTLNEKKLLDLPPPISHRTGCARCPYLTVCSSSVVQEGLDTIQKNNPLRELAVGATSHLSDEHMKYVFQWMGLILMERSRDTLPIWAKSSFLREEDGCGIGNLKVDHGVKINNGEFTHYFVKMDNSDIKEGNLKSGNYVFVSTDKRFALTAGFITSITPSTIEVSLERDITGYVPPFHIDPLPYSKSQFQIAFTNLALLLENTPKASSLRSSIIDLQVPKFATKLSSKVKKIGASVFSRLNKEQTRSVLQVLSAESYILVKGMPGTGKSSTVKALVELLVLLGKTVLLTSHTHSAVDNILVDLVGKVNFLRLGSTQRIRSELITYSEEYFLQNNSYSNTKELEDLYNSKPVIAVTCMGSGHFILDRREFDYCVVDEATQVDQATILRPLFSASKFVLIGDPEQLSPLVISSEARQNGFGVSLFQRLQRPSVTSILSLQYRMNKSITDLANGLTYENLLKCGSPGVENACLSYIGSEHFETDWMKKVMSKKIKDSVVFLDIEKFNDAKEKANNTLNKTEGELVLKVLRELKQVGVSGKDIGIMSPYRLQVEMLQRDVLSIDPEVEVNTIDQYQGRDKLVIILSCTYSSEITKVGILHDRSRLTVAVTRAKVKLVIVGNKRVLEGFKPFKKLFEHIPNENFVKVQY